MHGKRQSLAGCLVFAFIILLVSEIFVAFAADTTELAYRTTVSDTQEWRSTSPMRVVIRSTSDWGRILFDDLNGTNSNGIKIWSVAASGWMQGRDADDLLYAGRKIAWPDTEYDRVIARKGDMVAFFKGLGDFHYTEAYADVIFEVDVQLPRVYFWLMTGGQGQTTFEIVSLDTGGTLWRDIIVGTGETQQVKRVMSPQPFFRTGRAESTIVVTWLSIVIVAMIVLNFPILEAIKDHLRRSKVASIPKASLKHSRRRRGEEDNDQ